MSIRKEARRYLLVGGFGYVIDVGCFNLLSIALGSLDLFYGPVIYKIISATIAVSFTYVGNSRWTFRGRTGRDPGFQRILLYVFVNVIGLLVTVLPLYVSRYVLGFDSLLADNVSGNIIGVGLALAVRFYMNRNLVFLDNQRNKPTRSDVLG